MGDASITKHTPGLVHAAGRSGPSCGSSAQNAGLFYWPGRGINCPECAEHNLVFGVHVDDLCDADYALSQTQLAASSTVFPGYFCASCKLKFIAAGQWKHNLHAELAALERDAAISLLLDTPVECVTARLSGIDRRCGRCHPCRVDKFLRDLGART